MAQDDHISLNRILDICKDLGDRHKMIQGTAVGDEATRGHDKEEGVELDTPFLFLFPKPVRYVMTQNGSGIVAKEYTINAFIGDKHSDNAKNDQDIMSDTEGILSDLVQWVATHPDLRRFQVVGNLSAQLEVHTTIHEIYGWGVDIVVRVPYKYCHTQLPIGASQNSCV